MCINEKGGNKTVGERAVNGSKAVNIEWKKEQEKQKRHVKQWNGLLGYISAPLYTPPPTAV